MVCSDRCELNRQIRTDNALLRELKAQVKKLMDAVKNTIPAVAEAMENLRRNMIIFRYQLLHIRSGKAQLGRRLDAVRPELERYTGLVKQIKGKVTERQALRGCLAVITSEEEQNYLVNHASRDADTKYWIGATDELSEGTWLWVTGETFDYTNWGPTQPDNANSGEHSCSQ